MIVTLDKFLARKRTEMVNKLIASSQHRKDRILDIGCGEYPYFLINSKFNKKYGIDKLVEDKIFNNNKEEIFIKKCNIEKDKLRAFTDEYFDVVTMMAVIEHLEPESLGYVIKEIRRILKINGLFILTTPTRQCDIILQILAKLRLIDFELLKEHKAFYNTEKVSSMLIEGGFSKEDIKFGKFELFMNIWFMAVKT